MQFNTDDFSIYGRRRGTLSVMLLNRCWIRSVGYIQFCGNELVRQDHEPVALCGTIQDLK